MSTTCLSAKRLAVATLYVLVVPVLVVAAFMAVPSNAPGTTPAPHASYDRLMHVLQAGDGKQIDDGFFELYCDQASAPTGWIWAVDDTRDGDGSEYWILHSSYSYPGPSNDGVEIEFDHLSGVSPTSLNGAKAWIVNNNSHVKDETELKVHLCDVTLVP